MLVRADSGHGRRVVAEVERHACHNHIRLEQQCAFDEECVLIVQQVLPQLAGDEFRQNHGDVGRGIFAADLFEQPAQAIARLPKLDKILIDPPRAGAFALVEALGAEAPPRIVYVSCDPATLARDAGVLVHGKGYRLRAAGVVNMFPHTSHVESVALFTR